MTAAGLRLAAPAQGPRRGVRWSLLSHPEGTGTTRGIRHPETTAPEEQTCQQGGRPTPRQRAPPSAGRAGAPQHRAPQEDGVRRRVPRKRRPGERAWAEAPTLLPGAGTVTASRVPHSGRAAPSLPLGPPAQQQGQRGHSLPGLQGQRGPRLRGLPAAGCGHGLGQEDVLGGSSPRQGRRRGSGRLTRPCAAAAGMREAAGKPGPNFYFK